MNKGQPRRFATGEELKEAMKKYLRLGRFPSIAGFCAFCDMTPETYYQNRNYYPDAFKIIEMLLEDAVLNQHPTLNARVSFYLRNKFRDQYQDVIEQTIRVPDPIKTVNLDKLSPTELATMEAILQKANDDPNAK
jgi:hypothetical protein